MWRLIVFFFLLAPPSVGLAYSEIVEQLRTSTLKIRAVPQDLGAVPRGATRVPLLVLKFTAGCDEDVNINYLRVHKLGMGDVEDIDRLYALQGFRRLTRGTRFDSDGVAIMRLRNFVVRACTSEHLAVAVDFSENAAVGGNHVLMLRSREDLSTDAREIQAVFPVSSAFATADVTPDNVGQVTAEFLPIASVTTMRDELLAKLRITTSSDRHQILYGITLTNDGSAQNDDIRDLYLTGLRGRSLGNIESIMDGKQVRIRLSRPYFLRAGSTTTFRLYGTPRSARETIRFMLEEPSDLDIRSSRRSGRRLGLR